MKRSVEISIALVLLLVGVIVTTWGVIGLRERYRFVKTAHRTTAVVSAVEYGPGTRGTSVHPTFVLPQQGNRKIISTDHHCDPRDVAVGRTVQLLYRDGPDPSPLIDNFRNVWAPFVFLSGFGLIYSIVCIAGIFLVLRRRRTLTRSS